MSEIRMKTIASPPGFEQQIVEMTAEEIAEHDAANQAAIARKEKTKYRRQRAAEYPPIGDQLDALMKWLATEGEFNIPDELKSIAMTCMSVKAKYPKPKEE